MRKGGISELMLHLKVIRQALVVVLIACLLNQPAWSKAVDLDFKNPARAYPGIHKLLKPYHGALRRRIEQKWAQVDPRTGETATVTIVLAENGELRDLRPGEGSNTAQLVASEVVAQCAPFDPIPPPQPCLLVTATLRSRKPTVDPTPAVNSLMTLAMIALTGFSIYALCKLSASASGNVIPEYEWVNGYRRADGKYVKGYRRTVGDTTLLNNYSTRGNINPWNGQPGYVNPY